MWIDISTTDIAHDELQSEDSKQYTMASLTQCRYAVEKAYRLVVEEESESRVEAALNKLLNVLIDWRLACQQPQEPIDPGLPFEERLANIWDMHYNLVRKFAAHKVICGKANGGLRAEQKEIRAEMKEMKASQARQTASMLAVGIIFRLQSLLNVESAEDLMPYFPDRNWVALTVYLKNKVWLIDPMEIYDWAEKSWPEIMDFLDRNLMVKEEKRCQIFKMLNYIRDQLIKDPRPFEDWEIGSAFSYYD